MWMNAKAMGILCIACAALVLVMGGYAVLTARELGRCLPELAEYRARYQQLADTQQELARGLDESGRILSGTATTVRGLREQLTALRETYEDMERALYGAGGGPCDHDGHYHIEEVAE